MEAVIEVRVTVYMTSSSKNRKICALFRNSHQVEDLEDIIRENGIEKRDPESCHLYRSDCFLLILAHMDESTFFIFFFHLVLVNWMEWLLIPACPSLIRILNSGSIEGTNTSKMCVWCPCVLYDLFYICIGIDFVDLTEEKVYLYII